MTRDFHQRRAIQALSQGIMQHRPRLFVITTIACVAILSGMLVSRYSPVLDAIDFAILSGMLLLFVTGLISLYLLPRQWIYRLLVAWVGLTLLTLAAIVGNALFGSNAHRLLSGAQPYVGVYLPVAVLFAYVYLETHTASWLTLGFWLLLTVQVTVFVLRNEAMIQDWTAILLFFGTCTILPLHMAILVWVHQRIQASAVHLQAERKRAAEREHQRLRQLEKLDSVTGGLNERGLHEALNADMRRGEPVGLGVAKIKDYEELQRSLQRDEEVQLLRRLAAFISYAFGPATRWGLTTECEFVFWTMALEPTEFNAAMTQLEQRIAESGLAAMPGHELHFGRARRQSGTGAFSATDAEILLHDAELDLFKSMIGGFISEQT